MGAEKYQAEIEAGKENLIIDSALTFEQATQGKEIPKEILETLSLVSVLYLSYDGRVHEGQLVVHKDLAQEVVEIFDELLRIGFVIETVVPVSQYGWNDNISMRSNNSSSFNYRTIAGTEILSKHALGCAIDINPKVNPYVSKDRTILPDNFLPFDPEFPGTLIKDSPAIKVFTERGWTWGGDWDDPKDYQHFEKEIQKSK